MGKGCPLPRSKSSMLRRRVYIAHASSLAAALRGGALRATAGRPCLGTSCFGLIPLTQAAWRLRSAGAHFVRRPVGLASALRALVLFRSRKQPGGCAPRGRTSCDGRSALPRHFVLWSYSAHASSLAAALRGGALRATAGRPCLGTSCFGLIPLTQAAWRLRSAGAHFVRRPVGLASALRASEGTNRFRHPRENGDPMPVRPM